MHRILLSIFIASTVGSCAHAAHPKKPEKVTTPALSKQDEIRIFLSITTEIMQDLQKKDVQQLYDFYHSLKQTPSYFQLRVMDACKENKILLTPALLARIYNATLIDTHQRLAQMYGPHFDKEKSLWESIKDSLSLPNISFVL